MPKLLDAKLSYEPDSIYGASKKIASISLSNIANASLNPNTASKIILTGKSERGTDGAYKFISGLEQLKLLFVSIITYHKQVVRKLINTFGIDNPDIAYLIQDFADRPLELPSELNVAPSNNPTRVEKKQYRTATGQVVGSGRKKQQTIQSFFGKRPETSVWGSISSSDLVNPSQMVAHTPYQYRSRSNSQQSGASYSGTTVPVPQSNAQSRLSMNTPAAPASSSSGNSPANSQIDSDDDSDYSGSQFLYPGGSPPASLGGYPSDDSDSDNDGNFEAPHRKLPIADALIKASSLVERLSVLFLGSVNPFFNYLDQVTIQKIIQSISDSNNHFNHINHEFIGDFIENGDVVYGILRTRLQKLEMDVYIAVKSFAPPMSEEDSTNIPVMAAANTSNVQAKGGSISHFNRGYQKCSAKYLL
jgi:hypothetical protein